MANTEWFGGFSCEKFLFPEWFEGFSREKFHSRNSADAISRGISPFLPFHLFTFLPFSFRHGAHGAEAQVINAT